MSQENVEIVRRWWASLEAGELPFDLTDENVRIDNIEQPVVEGAYHGHRGLRAWWQDFAEAFEDIHFEVLEYRSQRAAGVDREPLAGALPRDGPPDRPPLGKHLLRA